MPPVLGRLALCLATVLLCCAAARAQWVGQGPGGGPPLSPSQPFTWTEGPHDLGPVSVPVGPGGGWLYLPGLSLQLRLVPSFGSDPTVEVILYPPLSGSPSKAEQFFLQFPVHAPAPGQSRALVLAFHPFGVSSKSPFTATELPYLCASKGYLLLAPYGLIDTNYANEPSQRALEAILALVRQWVGFDSSRVYAVGFSMGGLSALSYALRHQDPAAVRIAGVIDHSGPVDTRYAWQLGGASLKSLLADADHFGGTPAQQPFAYQRVSALVWSGGGADAQLSNVANALHLPFYLHCNTQDAFPELPAGTMALYSYLLTHMANVQLSTVAQPGVHAWSTLPMAAALDWIDDFQLGAPPLATEQHADRAARYLWSEVRELDSQAIASYQLSANPLARTLQIAGTLHLGRVALDLGVLGFDLGAGCTIAHASADGSADVCVLSGMPKAPSAVLAVGGGPAPLWGYDAGVQELWIQPSASGAPTQVVVVP